MEKSFENFEDVIKTKKHIDPAIVFDEAAKRKYFGERHGENRELECMRGLILDEIELPLTRIENIKIIDHILGEGASLDLAKNFREYIEKIGNDKRIIPFNSAKDFLLGSAHALFPSVKFIREADTAEKKEKRMETFKPFIVKEFNFLRSYLDLLENYGDFERKELGSVDGFLGGDGKIDRKVEKEKYLKVSAEALEKSGSKRKGLAH